MNRKRFAEAPAIKARINEKIYEIDSRMRRAQREFDRKRLTIHTCSAADFFGATLNALIAPS